MHEDDAKNRPIHENLDTAYVNLAALLRHLRGRDFVGLVHVALDEYEAEVSLDGESAPRVREIDHADGREGEGEAALQRLLVRAREPGGRINVYARADEEELTEGTTAAVAPSAPRAKTEGGSVEIQEELAWTELLRLSGELIAAVERATLSFGADFAAMFSAARLELADDFPFLDPATQRFYYAHSVVRMQVQVGMNIYLSSISETLRRVVDNLAGAYRGRSTRERVALELAVLARRRETAIRQFKLMPYLERIAGTKVL
ncbi:MAG TPA: hypothetical protein VF735_07845 [Pyrinomonadaceae bacterium]|jgi:hypothetical protein